MSLSPDYDAQAERMRMALAEAGYPDASVHPSDPGEDGLRRPTSTRLVPPGVMYMALTLTYPPPHSCFSCWLASNESMTDEDQIRQWECRKGNCSRPNEPKMPPPELLRRPT